jgi:CTP:molybdopterin cytidylyltransferase MocA
VLAGLRALFAVQEGTGPDGCVILPVDTAGIKPQTMQYIVSCAMSTDADVLRPVHAGHSGQVIWISRACALRMLKDRGLLRRRLDDYFKTMARELPVDDAHILNNINRTVNP